MKGCPGATDPTASHGPHSGYSLAWLYFKVAVNRDRSVNAATAAAAACLAHVASSAASSSRVFNRSNGGLLRAEELFSRGPCGSYAAPSSRHRQPRARTAVAGAGPIPSYPVPGPMSSPSTVPPIPAETPSTLDAIPGPAGPGRRGSEGPQGSNGTSGKTSYQTRRDGCPSSRLARRRLWAQSGTQVSDAQSRPSRSAQALSRPGRCLGFQWG